MYRGVHTFPGLWMSSKMRLGVGLGLATVLAIASGLAGQSASSGPGGGGGSGSGVPRGQFGMTSSPFDDMDPVMLQRHLTALNIERQKEMVSDTNKLLKLARELNDEVAASHATSFTPDQMRKIAEIEKLAKSVRERMTSAVGPQQPSPALQMPNRVNSIGH